MRLRWVSHRFHSFKREGILETVQTVYGVDGETETQLGKGQGQGQSSSRADPELELRLLNILPKALSALEWPKRRRRKPNINLAPTI